MIGFYNYTVWLTYMSLMSGSTGIALLMIYPDKPLYAIICLLFSGFCDLFDGKVARTKKNRTSMEKNFGIEIDSLTDLVCFGVLPAAILIRLAFGAFEDKVIFFIPLAVLYVLAGMIRLAYFDVLETERQSKEEALTNSFYWGLPITTASLFVPLGFFISEVLLDKGVINQVGQVILYSIVILILLVLFICKIKIPKFKTKGTVVLVLIGLAIVLGLILI